MIYVSHRLDEIFAISDRLAVLRDGKLVDMRDDWAPIPSPVVHAIIGRPPEKSSFGPTGPIHLRCSFRMPSRAMSAR